MKNNVILKLTIGLATLFVAQTALAHGIINVTTSEWGIKTSKETTGPGKITFVISNKGEDEHELEVVRIEPGQSIHGFPRIANKSADDNWVAPRGVGEVEDIKPGKTKKLTVNLKPGNYALICNMVEKESDGSIEAHYDKGMAKLFVVK